MESQHDDATRHIPVLLKEVLEGLQCRQRGMYLDGTLGCGGHTTAILEQHPNNRVIGLDRDTEALAIAGKRLKKFGKRVSLHHTRFEAFEAVLQALSCDTLDGVLLDLGVSSLQLDEADRGFSFQYPARLDMRMNRGKDEIHQAITAYDVVNTYSAEELADMFFTYGEERQSRRIAKFIIEARAEQPVETTTELADIVYRSIPRRFHPNNIHPATRVFQAIRIEVNDELQQLGKTLERFVPYLRPGGRICVISFHSLEDRIVKRTFAKLVKGCVCPPDFPVCVCGKQSILKMVSRKPIVVSAAEQVENPRSRSAKLRIVEKK